MIRDRLLRRRSSAWRRSQIDPYLATLPQKRRGLVALRSEHPYLHPMSSRFDSVPQPACADRSTGGGRAACRGGSQGRYRSAPGCDCGDQAAHDTGQAEIARRLPTSLARGTKRRGGAFLTEQLLRLLWTSRSNGCTEPHSHLGRAYDPDRGRRLRPRRDGAAFGLEHRLPDTVESHGWSEQVDRIDASFAVGLQLKVGHSSRSIDEMVRQAKADVTVRTALIESRYEGRYALYEEAVQRFRTTCSTTLRARSLPTSWPSATCPQAEGDSRYVVEPNVKEARWPARPAHALLDRTTTPTTCAIRPTGRGGAAQPARKYRQFRRAGISCGRCAVTCTCSRPRRGRRPSTSRRRSPSDALRRPPGKSKVERFMHFYFFGEGRGRSDRLFLAHLDEKFAARGRRFGLPPVPQPAQAKGFVLERGRLTTRSDGSSGRPRAASSNCFSSPTCTGWRSTLAMRAAARDAKLADYRARRSPRQCVVLDV